MRKYWHPIDLTSPFLIHICEQAHTQTESQGSWLWSVSCRVYEVQAAPVSLRSNKEAIKMLTDSLAPLYKLCAPIKQHNMWHPKCFQVHMVFPMVKHSKVQFLKTYMTNICPFVLFSWFRKPWLYHLGSDSLDVWQSFKFSWVSS